MFVSASDDISSKRCTNDTAEQLATIVNGAPTTGISYSLFSRVWQPRLCPGNPGDKCRSYEKWLIPPLCPGTPVRIPPSTHRVSQLTWPARAVTIRAPPPFLMIRRHFTCIVILCDTTSVMNIWQELPKPFFVLAPMEAVTDVVFRHVIARAAPPDLWFTEFTNATGWVHAGEKAIGGRLFKTDDESPIVAQLWGSNPEAMTVLARQCADWGYDGIDINMGCPDQSAIKGGGGAGMIRTPDIAAAIIIAAKRSGLPVSVKTRLGYTRVDEWRGWLSFLLSQNIAALTIHLRTKKEMSKVPAHFELIDAIKKLRDEIEPSTLLIINGDIRDRSHGLELVTKHGIDGVMIGRGVFANPFCFADTPHDLTEQKNRLLELLHYHLDRYDAYNDQTQRPYETLKRFFKIYIRDFDGAGDIRVKLMETHTTDEARAVLSEIN